MLQNLESERKIRGGGPVTINTIVQVKLEKEEVEVDLILKG